MQRKSFDRLVSAIGLLLAVIMIVAGGLLSWAHNFVHHEVRTQLAAQKIYFPDKGSAAIAAPEFKAMRQYAGEQLLTGKQAETYADHFIANHLKAIGGGKTYAQLSAQAQADPTNTKLAAQVDEMFKGETLRGLLLNAYAFDTVGSIAGIAAVFAYIAGIVMLVLAGLGLWHSGRVKPEQSIFEAPAATGPPADVTV